MFGNVPITTWARVAYIVVSPVTLLLTAVIVLRLVRGVLRAISGGGSVFGTDARSRVIGFELAAMLFPQVLPELVRLTVALFGDFSATCLHHY